MTIDEIERSNFTGLNRYPRKGKRRFFLSKNKFLYVEI